MLVLVNVQPSIDTIHTTMFFSAATIREYQNELAAEALEKAGDVLTKEGMPFESVVRIGYPPQEICWLAEERNAKYIVIGSRGLSAIKGEFLGSVSNGVLHGAPCPVVVIPKVKK